MTDRCVNVIGAGLAGCEAAWQLARAGVRVRLHEMKPAKRTPAHQIDGFAELCCSNSLRSDTGQTAVGLLHAELRALGSLAMAVADACRVPAGEALAVDRLRFAEGMTDAMRRHPLIELALGEVERLPEGPTLSLVATGPLTYEPLARAIAERCGEGLYFYDAVAPIVVGDSIDTSIAFRASRWGKGEGDDYLNLPLSKEEYHAFVEMLLGAEKVTVRAFEEPRYFDGCLPIEVLAERGPLCLAFGPMKPIGLTDPKTGRRPFAVVQLRPEDTAKTHWNLVGFQTRLTWPEQRRVLRTLPGMANAEFARMGQIHRNTYLEAPRLLAEDLSLRGSPWLFFGGQLSGVEGYVESIASGMLAAHSMLARLSHEPFAPPPPETALGALHRHLVQDNKHFAPSNITFALFPPPEERVKKNERRARLCERAREAFGRWMEARGKGADSACYRLGPEPRTAPQIATTTTRSGSLT